MPNTKVVGIIFPYILRPIPNLYDHSFPRYGQITFLTFRRPTTLTFDLTFWKYLSVTVYPYVICMPSFIMIGWEMAEILHFEILRKHGQTHKQTNKQMKAARRAGTLRNAEKLHHWHYLWYVKYISQDGDVMRTDNIMMRADDDKMRADNDRAIAHEYMKTS